MQYAPTLVRLKSGLDWGMDGLHFRPHQGVCDTPLHLFDENLALLGDGWASFPPTSGRMRYAPTLVLLKSGLDWGMGEPRLRSYQGVCDTPLHLAAKTYRKRHRQKLTPTNKW